MGETTYSIKDLLLPFLGNHRSAFVSGDVAKDCAVTELNVLEAKVGDGCFVGGDFFRGSLVESQLAIVDGGEGDSRDVGPRERAGDHIVFSADVTHVCGKLADERQVASLTRRTLGSTGEGESEGLMISEDSELAALDVVAKVFYREEDGQQFAIESAVLLSQSWRVSGKRRPQGSVPAGHQLPCRRHPPRCWSWHPGEGAEGGWLTPEQTWQQGKLTHIWGST